MISIVTATRNVDSTILRLYESLLRQGCRDFEWILVDGLSTDSTVPRLQELASRHSWVRFVSEPDFGFYDALNKGIAMARGQYYIVAGADDEFEPGAIGHYAKSIESPLGVDVVLARVIRAGAQIGGFHPERAWISPAKVFSGSHSVGMLIRKDLHKRFGLYSKRFPLLADSYFLKCLLKSGSVRFLSEGFVAGTFAEGGLTSTSKLQILAETWQIQLLTERQTAFQTLLFICKIFVRWSALKHELRNQKSIDRNGK